MCLLQQSLLYFLVQAKKKIRWDLGYYWFPGAPSASPVSKAFLGRDTLGGLENSNNNCHFHVPGIILLNVSIHVILTKIL